MKDGVLPKECSTEKIGKRESDVDNFEEDSLFDKIKIWGLFLTVMGLIVAMIWLMGTPLNQWPALF